MDTFTTEPALRRDAIRRRQLFRRPPRASSASQPTCHALSSVRTGVGSLGISISSAERAKAASGGKQKTRSPEQAFCCEPHRTRTCNQGIKSTRNGRCTIPIQGLLPAVRLLRWCASSPLDFSVCHEPKRCKRHYTKMLCRVNDKFACVVIPLGIVS